MKDTHYSSSYLHIILMYINAPVHNIFQPFNSLIP